MPGNYPNTANMSDDEYAIDAEGDAGSATTYPLEAGQIRKGGYIVVKGRPCKVVDVSTSKTGKHGHAKCHFVTIDIFTGKKLEELCPASHNAMVPFVLRNDYQVGDCEEAVPGEPISLLDLETFEPLDGYNMPPDIELCKTIKSDFDDGKDVFVTLLEAMGEAMISTSRTGLED